MHTLKFKRFSTHIVPVTNGLMIFLIILSVIGFILLFFITPDGGNNTQSIDNTSSQTEEDNSYREEIIGTEHY